MKSWWPTIRDWRGRVKATLFKIYEQTNWGICIGEKMKSEEEVYAITKLVFGFTDSILITAEQFNKIREAKHRLIFGVGIEEKFDLVLENYSELERTLIDMALEHSIFKGKIENLLDGGTHLINRRIINFLTTTRLYLDQIYHDLSSIYGKDSGQFNQFKTETKMRFDTVFGYRFMEALRNHVQHHNLPTQGIKFPLERDESSGNFEIRFGAIPMINVASLEDNPKFKKSVLKELKDISNKDNYINPLPYIREFTEALALIHQNLRDLTKGDLQADEKLIQEFVMRAQKKFKTDFGLFAVIYTDNRVVNDQEYLTSRPTKRRQQLEGKNKQFESLSRRFVSSKSSPL